MVIRVFQQIQMRFWDVPNEVDGHMMCLQDKFCSKGSSTG